MTFRFQTGAWLLLVAISSYSAISHAHESIANVESLETDHRRGEVPNSFASVREQVKKCYKGTKDSWADSVKELIIDPYNFLAHASPELTRRYLEHCDKSVDCKQRLYYEAHGSSATGRDADELEKPMGFKKLDVLNRNALSRMNSSYESNQRLQQDAENKKWVEGKPSNIQIAMNPAQDNASFWMSLKDYPKNLATAAKKEGQRAMSDIEVLCYDLGQIIDPTLAAGAISKIPKGAKIAEAVDVMGKYSESAVAKKIVETGFKASVKTDTAVIADGLLPKSPSPFYEQHLANPSAYLSDDIPSIKKPSN